MRPRRTVESNTVFHLVGENEDHDLWTAKSVENGEAIIQSVWVPSDEERLAVAEGANIELTVWGSGTPPVAIRTTTVALGKAPTDV